MDFSKIKVPIAVVGLIIAQAFGIIWYVAQLDSTVSNLDVTVTEMQASMTDTSIAVLETDMANLKEQVDDFVVPEVDLSDIDNRLDEIEKIQAVINNEMRTIMADHGGFAEALSELRQSGLLPSGEKREYGGY